MKKFRLVYSSFLLIIIIFNSTFLFAQWSGNPEVNTPICNAGYSQINQQIIPDNSGGAIIAWLDSRDGVNTAIYAQRINSEGFIQWQVDGVPVCTFAGGKVSLKIASDEKDGAFLTWTDTRTDYGDIYAQRINSEGVIQWSSDGVPICAFASYMQKQPAITVDGDGGAIISWEDQRSTGYDMYAQRIDSMGTTLWTTNGVVITDITGGNCTGSNIISDGLGGAFVAWEDNRGNIPDDIYIQHISSSGSLLWTQNGLLVIAAQSLQRFPALLLDGSDGLIIIWSDNRSQISNDIYAQKINVNTGAFYWDTSGVPICTNPRNEDLHKMVSDGAGGAIITWESDHNQIDRDIFAQRISATGQTQWMTDGITICNADGQQLSPSIITDVTGGAIIAWSDSRTSNNPDIYAQKIDVSGNIEWVENGVEISIALGNQVNCRLIPYDQGGAIITWTDARSGNFDIYTQQVSAYGVLGQITSVGENEVLPSHFVLNQNYPNPFNPSTTISFSIPNEELISLKVFNSLGEEVAELIDETKPAGNYSVSFDASKLTSGIYFYKISAGTFTQTRKMILVK